MKNNQLEIGDEVIVFFDGDVLQGKLTNLPKSPGELWEVVDSYGKPHYCQTFQRISFNGIVETTPPEKDEEPCPF